MADYERSTSVGVSADRAFAWLADPANMPLYIATMTVAVPAVGGLHVAAEVEGRGLEEGDATFSADRLARHLDWGQAGSQYHGGLDVLGDASSSTITIRLHTRDDSDAAQTEQALDDTMANIRRELAG